MLTNQSNENKEFHETGNDSSTDGGNIVDKIPSGTESKEKLKSSPIKTPNSTRKTGRPTTIQKYSRTSLNQNKVGRPREVLFTNISDKSYNCHMYSNVKVNKTYKTH